MLIRYYFRFDSRRCRERHAAIVLIIAHAERLCCCHAFHALRAAIRHSAIAGAMPRCFCARHD